jgi:HAD superfamily hydrolase (TIGR01509 family)
MSLALVVFDCDGVLVDSETVAARVTAAALAEQGWPVTPEECLALFNGLSLPDCVPIIEARLGKLPPGWLAGFTARILHTMAREVQPMEGALAMLQATDALGLPWRVASNSGRPELAAKFAATGLASLVGDRFHSVSDGGRGKPAPDLYLAAAAAAEAPPAACLVIEDSRPGILAARAAGMACLAYAPRGLAPSLRALGVPAVDSHARLPALFARARLVGPSRMVEELL